MAALSLQHRDGGRLGRHHHHGDRHDAGVLVRPRRGLALSLALTGASAGGFTIAPLLVRLVHRMGLEQAVLLLVLGGLAILLPMVLAGVGRVPAEAPARADAARGTMQRRTDATADRVSPARRRRLRSLHFWTVSLPFALALAAQVGFIVHQVAFLLPRLGNDGAGVAIAATAIAAAVGRLAFAPVIDRLNQRLASAASFASQAVGLGLMLALPEQPVALYVGSVVFGLSVGNVITLPALIVQREFAAAVVRPGDRTEFDGRAGDAGIRPHAARPGARRHRRLRRGARAVHRSPVGGFSDRAGPAATRMIQREGLLSSLQVRRHSVMRCDASGKQRSARD